MHQLYVAPKNCNVAGRVILAISQEDGCTKKRITVLRQNLPLPFGFSSVDVIPHEGGVQFREAGTSWPIAKVRCQFECSEEDWADLLPILSEAYLIGVEAGQNTSGQQKNSNW